MKKRVWILGRYIAVGVFICVELVLGYQDTPTSDESRHLRDGSAILATGYAGINPEHPPLLKVLSAFVLPASERRTALASATGDPMTDDARFAVSLRLVGRRLLRARIPAILLAAAGLLAFGSLLSRISQQTGFVATLILGASAPFLAHSHYVTTDVAPIAFALLALWALISLRRRLAAIFAGVFLGACLVSKFSAPLLFPFLMILVFFRLGWKGIAVVLLCTSLIVLGTEAYATRGMTRGNLDILAEQAFVHGGLGGAAPPSPALAYSSKSLVRLCPPLGIYWIGFWSVANRSSNSNGVDYWMGRIVAGPEPLYPIATLAFKDDLPFLFLVLLGAIVAGMSRRWRFGRELWLVLVGGLIYLSLACSSSMHLGIRHLLLLVILLSAAATAGFFYANRHVRLLFWALVVAHVLVAAYDFPHFTSTRNIASRLFLAKSVAYDMSDDWGQDLGRFLNNTDQPIEYVSLIDYRLPDWRGLFPKLDSQSCTGCSLYLVDQIAMDILDASKRDDVPEAGRRKLASLHTVLDQVAAIRKRGRPIPIAEPTLRLFEIKQTDQS